MTPSIRSATRALARLSVLLALSVPPAAAGEGFEAWLADFRAEALAAGISAATLAPALADLEVIPRIIELDRDQPEGRLSFADYLRRVLPESRAEAASVRFNRHRALLEVVAARYRVQPRFIVALWGIESDFGRHTGGFPVIGALATLAYDGRRSAFFRGELLDALRILDAGDITLAAMTGSWAGAMGQSQFMPSSYQRFAVDYDGDGRRDIWGTPADVFASIANYLRAAGWRDDQTWGREVRLPGGFDPRLVGMEVIKPIGAWQALGVRRANGRDLPTRQLPASILLPDGPGGRAFMVYDNFRATLEWNRSIYFALVVGLLADRLAGG